MGTLEKTPYERDQDQKVAIFLFMAWLCGLIWAWSKAFESETPIQTLHFWFVFGLLWGPLSWIVIAFKEAKEDE